MACFICKRSGKKMFNINLCCGKGQNTIKADIIEFLGNNIIDYLKDDQCACSVCMNMLDDLVRCKVQILDTIICQNKIVKPPDLGRIWKFLAKEERRYEDSYANGCDSLKILSNTPPLSSSRDSASPLLMIHKSKMYDEVLEREVERREGIKSELRSNASSRNSFKSMKSSDNRKAKYKINLKSKKMKNDIVRKFQKDQDLFDRPVSVAASEMSFVSFTEEDRQEEEKPKKHKIIYEGDEIVFPLKRTRSVSRILEENREEREEQKARIESKKFKETMNSCDICGINCYKNLEVYTAHKVSVHGLCGYFKCKYCENNYLTREHLSYHLKTHLNPVSCPICMTMEKNSEKFASHMEQHIRDFMTCEICHEKFETRSELNEHVYKKHRRKKILDKYAYKIQKTCIYKEVEEKSITTKMYKSLTMDVMKNENEEQLKTKSWVEQEYLHERRTKGFNEDLCERLERLCSTPDSEGSLYNYKGIPSKNRIPRRNPRPPSLTSGRSTPFLSGRSTPFSPNERCTPSSRGRSPFFGSESGRSTSLSNFMSGRSTPFPTTSNGNEKEDDHEVMRMLSNNTLNELTSRRDLESRNTELAEIFAGEGDEDELNNSPNHSERGLEEVEDVENVSDEVETETQYLDGNNFVSSISYNDTEVNKEEMEV